MPDSVFSIICPPNDQILRTGILTLCVDPNMDAVVMDLDQRSHSCTMQSVSTRNNSNCFVNSSSQDYGPAQAPISGYDLTISDRVIANTDFIKSHLAALLPLETSSFTGLLRHRHLAMVKAFESPTYRILIGSIENNFAGLDNVFIGDIMKLLKADKLMKSKLVSYLNQTPKAIATALIEKLLVAAIEDMDATTVTDLLGTGVVDPGDVVCLVEGRRFSAVKRSAMLGNTEVLSALLHAGAKVDTSRCSGSALSLALGTMKRNGSSNRQMISILLNHGAMARVEDFLTAVTLKDKALIKLLLSNLQKYHRSLGKEFIDPRETFHFLTVIKNLKDDFANEIVEQLMLMITAQVLRGTENSRYSSTDSFGGMQDAISKAITCAITIGHIRVVKTLLPYTKAAVGPLAMAIRQRSSDLIQFILKSGVDVAYGLCWLDDDVIETTPLAEAIQSWDKELICKLEYMESQARPMRNNGYTDLAGQCYFEAALYAASKVGNLAYVRKLWDEHPQNSFRDRRCIGPGSPSSSLSIAVENGHDQIALYLLDVGAYVTAFPKCPRQDHYHYRHHDHYQIRNQECYDEELYSCSDVAVFRKHPLFLALHRRNWLLFDTLLECNIKMTTPLGSLCFAEAFDCEELWVIDSLFAMRPYKQQEYLRAGLTAAIKTGKKLMVDLIIDKFSLSLNVEDHYTKDAALAVAMRNNELEMVQHLLDSGADPRHAFCPPIYEGEKPPSRDILFEVLPMFKTRYSGGIKGLGATALQYAMQLEDIVLLDAMLDAKLDVNARDEEYTPLGLAIAQTGHRRAQIVEKILMVGGDANSIVWMSKKCSYSTGMPRRTALLEAISTKNAALVELLINFGADIRRPARLGLKRTPLQQACEVGSIEIADRFFGLGVDVNEKPAVRGGGTSLQLCAIKGYVGIANRLLDEGADIHAATSVCYGRTPLQGSAENGRLNMIPVLWNAALTRKFDRDDCKRAMDLAKENGHIACHDLIKELHG